MSLTRKVNIKAKRLNNNNNNNNKVKRHGHTAKKKILNERTSVYRQRKAKYYGEELPIINDKNDNNKNDNNKNVPENIENVPENIENGESSEVSVISSLSNRLWSLLGY